MSAELEERIVAALTAENMPAEPTALVEETEAAISEAEAAAEAARKEMADLIASPDVCAARAKVELTEFVAERLRGLLPGLQNRCQETEAAEYLAKWRNDHEKLKAERDDLAAELCEVYPPALTAIVDVLARIADHERRVSTLEESRPPGVKGQLLGPELVAREMQGFSRDQPSIACELKLPDWVQSNKLAWPPRSTPLAVLVAEGTPTDHPRNSADWYEVQKADIAKRAEEEQKRIEAEASLQEESKRAYERLPR
jgi:hypothetical protein